MPMIRTMCVLRSWNELFRSSRIRSRPLCILLRFHASLPLTDHVHANERTLTSPPPAVVGNTSLQLRRRYSDEALRQMPRLLLMVDRNRYSPTYGCFDRSYWHYRTMDFPCGMSQEFCLPLALAYATPFPDNEYYQIERVRELACAGIDFA